jgi:hypothetical protein
MKEQTKVLLGLGEDDLADAGEPSLDERLRDLADREELRELIARYAHRVALGVSPADLFTDDGAIIYTFPGQEAHETRGRENLDRSYGESALIAERPLPMLHNILLKIDGDTAIGLCSNEVRVTQDGESMIGSGYYEDRFRREDGRWRFAVREVTMFHWVPLRQGWAQGASSA